MLTTGLFNKMNNQDHLIHGVSLLVFVAALLLLQETIILHNAIVVIAISAVYVVVNIGIDVRSKSVAIDHILEYVAIAILACVVLLSV